jgi:hypothetical protein
MRIEMDEVVALSSGDIVLKAELKRKIITRAINGS